MLVKEVGSQLMWVEFREVGREELKRRPESWWGPEVCAM